MFARPTNYEAHIGPGARGPLRSPSMGGAVGGRESRTSVGAGLFSTLNGGGNIAGFGANLGFSDSEFSILSNNEKSTMQNLNDRLAAYLEKVRSLEEVNQELELKIHEFLKTRSPVIDKDLSDHYANISLLQSQIQMATMENWGLMQEIDNERLAMEDFKMKYETWLMGRKRVEQEINDLRRVRDELTLVKSDLEMQIEGLNQELVELKKNHEEEQADLQNHMGGEVNVELNCGPGLDLLKVLGDMREQYEALTAKNRSDLEKSYQVQSADLKKEVAVRTETTQTSKSEVTELKRLLQSLEIELQSALSMKDSTEHMLAETEARYGAELQKLQVTITRLEKELSGVRSDLEHNSYEYQELLGLKMRLEQEIDTYRRLLEGDDLSFSLNGENERAIGSTVSSTMNSSLKSSTTEASSAFSGSIKSGATTNGNSMSSGQVTDRATHSSTLSGSSKSDGTMKGSSTSGNSVNGSIESDSSRGAIALDGNTSSNKAKSADTMNGNTDSVSSVNISALNASLESGSTGSSTAASGSTISSSTISSSTVSDSSVIGSTGSTHSVTIISDSTMNGSISNGTTEGGSTKKEVTMNGGTTGSESDHFTFGSSMNGSAVIDSIEIGHANSGSIEYESDSNESEIFELGSPLYSPASGITRRSIKIRRVRKVIQDLIDGRVVSTSTEETEEPIDD
ncbi:keratin, type I cytoskeletal 19-like [Lissotriton helveticus]